MKFGQVTQQFFLKKHQSKCFKMRIYYIFTSPSLNNNSVQNKVLSQIAALKLCGAICTGAFFSTQVLDVTKYSDEVSFYPVKKTSQRFFNKIHQRKRLDKALDEFIKREYDNTDFFYIRNPGATLWFLKLLKKYGNKIVIEHQSKELDEIKSLMKENIFGFKLSQFLSWLQYSAWPYYNEKYFGHKINKNIRASIAVTNEIADYQRKKGSKKVFTITNGIAVKKYTIRQPDEFKNELNLLFLKGSSGYSPWNGFDRLVDSIDQYNLKKENKIKIKLFVFGQHTEGEVPKRDYIIEGGYITGQDLDDVFNKMHIGVSGIQVYLKNFKEATSLKIREYVARGLPFFYAYTDPDLNEDSKEFSLEFPNDDSLIDMEKVIEFAKKALEDKELPQKMRKYAEEHLDYEVKMKQLYTNLEGLMK